MKISTILVAGAVLLVAPVASAQAAVTATTTAQRSDRAETVPLFGTVANTTTMAEQIRIAGNRNRRGHSATRGGNRSRSLTTPRETASGMFRGTNNDLGTPAKALSPRDPATGIPVGSRTRSLVRPAPAGDGTMEHLLAPRDHAPGGPVGRFAPLQPAEF